MLHHLVEPVHARGRLFAHAAPVLDHVVPMLLILGENFLQQVLDHLLLVIAGRRIDPAIAVLQLIALVDEQRRVAAVVDDQLRPFAALVRERAICALPVVLEALALPREDRNTRRRNRCRRVILRRKDVATRPAHFGAQAHQRFNQDRCLNGHVQRSGYTHAVERLFRCMFVADRHQPRHLLLGNDNFFAAPIGQAKISHFVFGLDFFEGCGCHSDLLLSSYRDMLICNRILLCRQSSKC